MDTVKEIVRKTIDVWSEVSGVSIRFWSKGGGLYLVNVSLEEPPRLYVTTDYAELGLPPPSLTPLSTFELELRYAGLLAELVDAFLKVGSDESYISRVLWKVGKLYGGEMLIRRLELQSRLRIDERRSLNWLDVALGFSEKPRKLDVYTLPRGDAVDALNVLDRKRVGYRGLLVICDSKKGIRVEGVPLFRADELGADVVLAGDRTKARMLIPVPWGKDIADIVSLEFLKGKYNGSLDVINGLLDADVDRPLVRMLGAAAEALRFSYPPGSFKEVFFSVRSGERYTRMHVALVW